MVRTPREWIDSHAFAARVAAVSNAEITAYESAGTPEQIETETLTMRQKYGI